MTGNLVPDAYLAAIAIESGCELATAESRLRPVYGPALAPPADRDPGVLTMAERLLTRSPSARA